jgi:hypothetical protein
MILCWPTTFLSYLLEQMDWIREAGRLRSYILLQ